MERLFTQANVYTGGRKTRFSCVRYGNVVGSRGSEVITPLEDKRVKAGYHIYVIQLRTELLKVGRKKIFEALRAENIGVNVHYIPLHLHPFYQKEFGYRKGDYPRAERYYERAITLPIFPKMSDEDVEDVTKAVKKVVTYYRR